MSKLALTLTLTLTTLNLTLTDHHTANTEILYAIASTIAKMLSCEICV